MIHFAHMPSHPRYLSLSTRYPRRSIYNSNPFPTLKHINIHTSISSSQQNQQHLQLTISINQPHIINHTSYNTYHLLLHPSQCANTNKSPTPVTTPNSESGNIAISPATILIICVLVFMILCVSVRLRGRIVRIVWRGDYLGSFD